MLQFIGLGGEAVNFAPSGVYHVNPADVTGLAGLSNDVYTHAGIGQHGETFLSSRLNSREIEIAGHIAERDRQKAAALAAMLIRSLNPSSMGVLVCGARRVDCKVQSLNFYPSPILQRFVLTLACPSPFWRDAHSTRRQIAMWEGLIEFPYPQGLEMTERGGHEMGRRNMDLIAFVQNPGDVRTGLEIHFIARGTCQNPMLIDMQTRDFLRIVFTLQGGDRIVVKTGYGEKSVQLLRAGQYTNIFRNLDIESTFLQLETGENIFRYDAADGLNNLEVDLVFSNRFLAPW